METKKIDEALEAQQEAFDNLVKLFPEMESVESVEVERNLHKVETEVKVKVEDGGNGFFGRLRLSKVFRRG